ncbi:MAG: type II toxin-antitoxin system mRNA interferase toxin, RelE/StbE family [Candidatus Vogelbacteria bacterium]|nr:type II toxin-antitoxin system mRNA interferase toxin, RelE/StbE family [Candidatus Vogelbacteria bacterium]
MIEIETTTLYRRRFKKLTPQLRRLVIEREKIFVANPFDHRLGTHKLHGKRKEEWAYWVDYSYRVAFLFLGNNKVLYTEVGTHDELYR